MFQPDAAINNASSNTEPAPPVQFSPESANTDSQLTLENLFNKAAVPCKEFAINTYPLFDGLICRGQTVVIQAEHGLGSTWVAVAIGSGILSANSLFLTYSYIPASSGHQDTVLMVTAGLSETVIVTRLALLCTREQQNKLILVSKEYQKKSETHGNNFDLHKSDWLENLVQALDDGQNGHLICIFDNLDSLVNCDNDIFKKCFESLHLNPNLTPIWIDKGTKKGFEIPSEYIDLKLELKPIKDRSNVSMEIDFLKANSLPKEKTKPFVIELQENPEGEPKMRFCLKTPEVEKAHIAVAMLIEGIAQAEIAERLKVSQSMVSKWRSDAIEQKLIVAKGHNSIATPAGEKLIRGIKVNI